MHTPKFFCNTTYIPLRISTPYVPPPLYPPLRIPPLPPPYVRGVYRGTVRRPPASPKIKKIHNPKFLRPPPSQKKILKKSEVNEEDHTSCDTRDATRRYEGALPRSVYPRCDVRRKFPLEAFGNAGVGLRKILEKIGDSQGRTYPTAHSQPSRCNEEKSRYTLV